jgi:hypothetical protein
MDSLKLIRVRQSFDDSRVDDVARAARDSILSTGLTLRPGSSIAVAVGSRGVAHIGRIVRETVAVLREMGARPFIVPAMGSHGGATAEGQQAVLEGYGVSEALCGAPVRSSMETVELASGTLPHRLFVDRLAWEADGIVLVNRVKPHTDYHGPFESGLIKMAVIGLGKHDLAREIHRYGAAGLKERVLPAFRRILAAGKIALGIGIVENAYDEVLRIRAMRPQEIESAEGELLALARRHMPFLPVDRLDLLIVDEIGKDVSGTGMDSNIIGRIRVEGQAEPDRPRISRIVAADLTGASHGNATGMGLADFITRRLRDRIDFAATYENTLISTFLERGKMPIVCPTAARAARQALETCWITDGRPARVIRIRSTLRLATLFVSPPVFEEIRGSPAIESDGVAREMLAPGGELVPFERA